ncbi:MAG: exodeoxyribonuclease VII small subunit [Holosporales bacterium]|jgi:exodeoxyribonuclease VII small subunit
MKLPPVSKLSFEAALAELEAIVRSLESGNIPLENAITQFERGAALEAHCRTHLEDARLRIEQITSTDSVAPFAHG